jgi:transcriptional regulator with XRE-family HTH domain
MTRKILGSLDDAQGAPPIGLQSRFGAELPLHELRQAKALSQVDLAKALHVHQAAVSKMEHRTDMYISTLRQYIHAMGGNLEIIARFADGAVKISNFDDPAAPHVCEGAGTGAPRRHDAISG